MRYNFCIVLVLVLTTPKLLMFRYIIKNDTANLKILCDSFAKIDQPSATLLRCLNQLLLHPQEVDSMTVSQMQSHLTYLQLFAAKYRELIRTDQLEASALAQRLFGFSLDKSGIEATVFLTSFIAHQPNTPLRTIRKNERDQPVVKAKNLRFWIKKRVESHMISILHKHAVTCLEANSFAPLCSRYLEGQMDCPCLHLHVRKDCATTFYSEQMCLYFKQIKVLSYAEPREIIQRRDQRKYVCFTMVY